MQKSRSQGLRAPLQIARRLGAGLGCHSEESGSSRRPAPDCQHPNACRHRRSCRTAAVHLSHSCLSEHITRSITSADAPGLTLSPQRVLKDRLVLWARASPSGIGKRSCESKELSRSGVPAAIRAGGMFAAVLPATASAPTRTSARGPSMLAVPSTSLVRHSNGPHRDVRVPMHSRGQQLLKTTRARDLTAFNTIIRIH